MADAEPAGPVLHVEVALLLLVIEQRAEPVEPGVAGDRQRLGQRQVRVDVGLDIVEHVVAHRVRARAGKRRVRADQSRCEARLGDDRLEGRAGRIDALCSAVDEQTAGVIRIEQRAKVLRVGRRPRLVEPRVARERVDGAVAGVHHDGGAGVSVVVAVGVRERDPVLNRLLGDPLQPQVDGELESARGARDTDDARRPDRAALSVDDDARLVESAVQQAVVGGLRAGLPHDRAGALTSVRVRRELARADLAQQAEEFTADRPARVAPLRQGDDADPGELARMLVEEEAEVAGDPRQDDCRGVRRFEFAVADALDEAGRWDSGEVAEPPEEHAALVRRPPAAVLVDDAENRRIDRDGEPAPRSRQDAALRVDDLTARGWKVDEAERLALGCERKMRPPHDLERPKAQRQQAEETEGDEPDHPDAEEEAGAAVKVGGGDRNRTHAETPRNADAAPAAPRMRDEVAQRARSRSASGASAPGFAGGTSHSLRVGFPLHWSASRTGPSGRPRRRTTWGSLCSVGKGAIAVRTAKDARF